jgi:hypothetical protein
MVTSVERRGDAVRVVLRFVNNGADFVRVYLDYQRTMLTSGSGDRYAVGADAVGTSRSGTFSAGVFPGSFTTHWIEFDVPRSVAGGLTLTIAGTGSDGTETQFPPLTVLLTVP